MRDGELCGPREPLPLQVILIFPRTLILLLLLVLNLLIFEVLAELSAPQEGFSGSAKLKVVVSSMFCTSHIPVCGDHLPDPMS